MEVCPNRANYTYTVQPVHWSLPLLTVRGGVLEFSGRTEVFRIEQARQVVHVDDFCNACGNCATFCVHNGEPFADKPRLFLDREDFHSESDNAYLIERGSRGWVMRARQGGAEARLEWRAGGSKARYEEDRKSVV